MPALSLTASLLGLDAVEVRVEAEIIGSLRKFSIVGLPDSALRESRERVRCAVENSGFSFPRREVIVSLSPASLPKSGAGFDLAIALSILAADGQIDADSLRRCITYGELALSGSLRAAGGIVAISQLAASSQKELLIAPACAAQAGLVPNSRIRVVPSLTEAVLFLQKKVDIPLYTPQFPEFQHLEQSSSLHDVIGQHAAKRALEIAAAGAHNILLIGPPGTGKSMLAKRLITLMPDLTPHEALEIAQIYSAISAPALRHNVSVERVMTRRPYRAPHHTTSTAGLIGGGSYLQPGDVSLAHHGVLFLDELPEFRRDALEALREPLESKEVLISRARFRARLPANFMLVAAMNPCPCGKRGLAPGACSCPLGTIDRYRTKLSGPVLDRIDLHVWVPQLSIAELNSTCSGHDPTTLMKSRINTARERQRRRTDDSSRLNNQLERQELNICCALNSSAMALLESAAARYQLSARSYVRVLRVARTIADLEDREGVHVNHIAEALSYRGTVEQQSMKPSSCRKDINGADGNENDQLNSATQAHKFGRSRLSLKEC